MLGPREKVPRASMRLWIRGTMSTWGPDWRAHIIHDSYIGESHMRFRRLSQSQSVAGKAETQKRREANLSAFSVNRSVAFVRRTETSSPLFQVLLKHFPAAATFFHTCLPSSSLFDHRRVALKLFCPFCRRPANAALIGFEDSHHLLLNCQSVLGPGTLEADILEFRR